MKKTLLTLALALIAFAASAQDKNYKWEFGGNFGFNSSKETVAGNVTEQTRQLLFEPFVGYRITPQFSVGLSIGHIYGHAQVVNGLGVLQDFGANRGYNIGPYVHYDFLISNRWRFFVEAEAIYSVFPKYQAYASPTTATAPLPYDIKASYFDMYIKPGVTYVVNDLINIDLYLNLLGIYGHYGVETRLDNNVETVTNNGGLTLDLIDNDLNSYMGNVTLGVSFKL